MTAGKLLDELRGLQPRGLERSHRMRELGITVEVHHRGRASGQLHDAVVRCVHVTPIGLVDPLIEARP
jgi:hypothetical protein